MTDTKTKAPNKPLTLILGLASAWLISSIGAPLILAQENSPGAAMPVTSPDGTVTALIPQGWQPFIFQEGVFAASGPNNAQVTKEQAFMFMDPRGMNASQHIAPLVPFTNDVGQAFKLAMNARAKNSRMGQAEVSIEKLTLKIKCKKTSLTPLKKVLLAKRCSHAQEQETQPSLTPL